MALFDDIADGLKKVALAGVGAVSYGVEVSQGIVDELVKRGEQVVEEGKAFNDEVARKVKEASDEASDEVLRTHLRGMSAEERANLVARAKKIADDLEVEDAEFEVEAAEAVEPDHDANHEGTPETPVEEEDVAEFEEE